MNDFTPNPLASGRASRFWIAFNDAWRGVTRKEIAWTVAAALAYYTSHAYAHLTTTGRLWSFPIRFYEWFEAAACLIFLVAFRFAEHPQLAPMSRVLRYAIAIPPALALYVLVTDRIIRLTSEVHGISGAEALIWDCDPRSNRWCSNDWDWKWNFIVNGLTLCVIGALVYSSLMRSQRAQAAFDAAALNRAVTRRRVTAARLSALQAQVDPAFLFGTLEFVETLYERDRDLAERTLDSLIDYLRTALPRVGEEGSTLGREAHLARAYLEITRGRMGSRLDARIDIPREMEGVSFPAMVLVPLIEHAIRHGLEPLPHGGRLEIRAARKGDRLEVTVSQLGANYLDPAWFDTLRERLTGLYGDAARLTATAGSHGAEATVDVPM